jgi:type II secretion system protein H
MVSFSISASRQGAQPGHRIPAPSREGGFTLIELMVAVAVMGVLMAIAIPTVATHMAQQELAGSAQQVMDVLRDARDSAVNEGQPRYVLFEAGDPGAYEIWRYDGSAWVQEEVEPLHESVSFTDADVTFPGLVNRPEAGAIVPENAAYFDTRGRYPFGSATSFTVTLHGGLGQTEVITLYSQTGQVSWDG